MQHRFFTPANVCTLFRFIIIPFMCSAILQQQWFSATLYLWAALISDIIDGPIARSCGQQSVLGAYLDHGSDKALTLAGYLSLYYQPAPVIALPEWFIILVVGKELLLLCGALYISTWKKKMPLKPLWWGKMGGMAQCGFLALVLTLSCSFFMPLMSVVWALYLTALLMIISLTYYIVVVIKRLRYE